MKFSFGVVAKLMFTDTPNVASILKYSEDVYDILERVVGHDIAASAESWTELASVGERYEVDKFEIEMMER